MSSKRVLLTITGSFVVGVIITFMDGGIRQFGSLFVLASIFPPFLITYVSTLSITLIIFLIFCLKGNTERFSDKHYAVGFIIASVFWLGVMYNSYLLQNRF